MQEMQEVLVGSLSLEKPMEKEMATHSSILAWKIPWTGESGGLQPIGSGRVRRDLGTEHKHTHSNTLNWTPAMIQPQNSTEKNWLYYLFL